MLFSSFLITPEERPRNAIRENELSVSLDSSKSLTTRTLERRKQTDKGGCDHPPRVLSPSGDGSVHPCAHVSDPSCAHPPSPAPPKKKLPSDCAQPSPPLSLAHCGVVTVFKVCILEQISFWLSTAMLPAHLDKTQQAGDLCEPFPGNHPHSPARVSLPCTGEYRVLTQLLERQYFLSHRAVAFCTEWLSLTQESLGERDRASGQNWSMSLFGFPQKRTPETLIREQLVFLKVHGTLEEMLLRRCCKGLWAPQLHKASKWLRV